jgi:hypothetical protein
MFKLSLVTSKGLWVLGQIEHWVWQPCSSFGRLHQKVFESLAKLSIEFGNHVQALFGYIKRSLSPWPKWALSLANMFKLWSVLLQKVFESLAKLSIEFVTMFKLWLVTSKGLWVLGQMSIEFGNSVQALFGYFNTSFQALRKRFKEFISYMQKIGKQLSVHSTHSSTSYLILI